MSLESAITKTSDYARRYGCRLTKAETEERLLGSKIYDLRKTNITFKKRNNNKFLGNKMKMAEILTDNLSEQFEDILMVAVTGSVASGYPKKSDDIDLLIVTKKDRLWLTRLKVRWYVWRNKIPHRKWEESHEKNKFCFNIWLDEERLKIPKTKQNLVNAIDLVLMKPVVDRNDIYGKMLKINKWAKKFTATGYAKKISDIRSQMSEKDNSSWVDKVINTLVFWPQYWYMKRKMKQELVGLKRAYFHPEG